MRTHADDTPAAGRSDTGTHRGHEPTPAASSPGSPTAMSATELLRAYATGSLSPVEATQAVLDQIERHNPAINAYCQVHAEEALAAARASERRWQRGAPEGELDGVPTSIKDIFLTQGWPTQRGSLTVDPAGPWLEDAPSTARLREANAVLLGKTTTPELAWKGVTDSPLTGITRNPWDLSCTPGGSSGGASAAVAAGMGPLATGTDGGGSVRIPASFTGIFALKPTYGRVPHYPASPYGTLAHAGPMTRTVADAALMMDVLSRPDCRDWSALPPPQESFTDAVAAPEEALVGMRVAYSPTLGYLSVDSEVAALVAQAVRVFEELGARVEEIDPGFGDPTSDFHCLWNSGAAKATAHLSPEQKQHLDPGLQEIIAEGLTYSAQDYLTAMATRMAMGERMGRFHETYDLLLTPTMPIPAFEAGHEVPPGSEAHRWTSWAGFSYPFNMTQQPAASVPCGFTRAGLPVGLQIVGARTADARVLAASAAFERACPWPTGNTTAGE
ncbi:amidase [Lipingzhangella sp. LS1_29]|uniref:Amidase n=1 Tax=Lipingzhangella rawalii TaxID=2055835 RepID=A0ABU2HAA9_9ACTN|nr:amidase [Lipingzhangella rawalii]MDS1271775.1 amidase [Lipingzhangella rawalii]